MNVLALLLIFLCGILIFFYYRITNPPISNNLKFILGILRFLFFSIVILLIFNPTLHFSRTKKVDPTTIILVDSSASMLQPLNSDETKSHAAQRWELELNAFLNEHGFDYKTIYFSNGLQQDSTTTDIFLALKELQNDSKFTNISDVILISDGLQHNNNSYPYVDELQFPVFPVLLGKDIELTDVSLDEILVNNPVFLNTETEISCRISGLPDSVQFMLSILDENDRILEEKLISKSNNERQYTLSYKPSKLGYQKLFAQVQLQNEQEFTLDNNSREFLISVVKDKAQFTLITSSLNWDITFIHRAFMKNERFKTSLLVQRKEGYFKGEKVDAKKLRIDLIKQGYPDYVVDKFLAEYQEWAESEGIGWISKRESLERQKIQTTAARARVKSKGYTTKGKA